MATSASQKKSQATEMTFEEAIAEFETLVREMESDQMPLDELMKSYERGSELHRICEKRLDEAQSRIELIRKNRSGDIVTEPFGGEKSDQSTSEEPENNASRDGELF